MMSKGATLPYQRPKDCDCAFIYLFDIYGLIYHFTGKIHIFKIFDVLLD